MLQLLLALLQLRAQLRQIGIALPYFREQFLLFFQHVVFDALAQLLHRGGQFGVARGHAADVSDQLLDGAVFFQCFVEVQVRPKAGIVRLLPYTASGRMRWSELQVFGQVIPSGVAPDGFVEFEALM